MTQTGQPSIDRRWWTLAAVCTGVFMLLLDITIVNVALPDIERGFHAPLSDLQWVIDAYALTLAAFLLTAGSLSDLFGRRRLFAAGITVDPETGETRIVADDFVRPNGLAFSGDETQLYIADSREHHIRRFDVVDGATLSGGEVFATCDAGTFDGLRLDELGRIWAAAHDGLHCFDPDGTLLGKLHLPEVVANLTFGGPKRNDLYITATSSLYAIRLNITGMRYPAPRQHG